MNTNVNIAGRTLLLDMGALEIMAEAVGTNWSDPLEGITELKGQAALILYGGMARKNEDDGVATQVSYDECKKIIRSLVPGDLIGLTRAYTRIMAIPDEPNAQAQAEEKKS